MLFIDELEKKIKTPDITLQQIKNLFEVYAKKNSGSSVDSTSPELPESNVDHNSNTINNLATPKKKKPKENGGKYGFNDYSNSPTINHDAVETKPGDQCFCCGLGKYYYGEAKKLLEFFGNPIINVTRHTKKVLRCNACGHETFSNKKITKWSPEARSSIAIYKLYGTPLYRIARLQKLFGIPVAVSTLWQKYKEMRG